MGRGPRARNASRRSLRPAWRVFVSFASGAPAPVNSRSFADLRHAWPVRRWSWLILLGSLGSSACATPRFHGDAPRPPDECTAAAPTGVRGRVAIVADTQFNTLHSSYRTLYRRRPVDRLFDVAIRPPALDYTSHYLLRAILGKQIAAGAEVVFFLGDGANNGCADELVGLRARDEMDGVLTVLRQERAHLGVPIFYVLGNHDYLGAGNTSALLRTRHALCNSARDGTNAPLTKLEVMRLVHEFNRESAGLAARWEYTDSWDEEDRTRACNGGPEDRPRNQHLRRGCWLGGHLRDAQTGVSYLLVDSNDYADTPASLLFAGRRGGVSFRPNRRSPSQLDWLRGTMTDAAPLRVVLSHYDVATINAADDRGWRHARLRRIVDPARTVWISAHTHEPVLRRHEHRIERGTRGHPFTLVEYNVGSSTDYPAYGILADTVDVAGSLSRVTAVFAASPERCEPVLTSLSSAIAGSDYFAFRRHTRGLGLFGLDFLVDFAFVEKEYRHRTWTRADDQHVRDNLRTWLAAVEPPDAAESRCGWPAPGRLHVGACVAMYASLQEGVKHGWAPITCDECRPRDDPAGTETRPRIRAR